LASRRASASSLLEGSGWLLLDELAETLNVMISRSGELDDTG